MKKNILFCLLTIFTITGIMLFNHTIHIKADVSDELTTKNTAIQTDGAVSPAAIMYPNNLKVKLLQDNFEEILYQDDFEDGKLAVADPKLTNGLTWTTDGDLTTSAFERLEGKILRMNKGAYALSNEAINQSEYTVSFTSINWYNTPARVMIEYQNTKNYYSICPTTGQVYRMLNGIEEELRVENVSRILSSPRQNPSINDYKIYFNNNGYSITISVDRDGYANGKDYEYTYVDNNARAVKAFKGGAIMLARVDNGSSRYWVNYDNILVMQGKLNAALPRDSAKLYVSTMGDDSYAGTEAKPFKTISKALKYSYPGDEIIVEDGVYDEQIKFASNRIYSEEENRLILRARNKHKASIASINFKYGEFVKMDGFKLSGGSIDLGKSTGVEVINNYIQDAGIGIKASGTNCRVADNYIYRCSFGIIVSGSNMLVENNEIERLIFRSGDADYFRFFGEGHIIRGNYMHGTRADEIGRAHVDGFQTFDNNGEYARHIIIEGNLIEDFYHQGFMGSGRYYYHSYDITFRNNIFKDAAAWGLCISTLKDVKVYNNIFINMLQHGVGFSGNDEMPATGEVCNNIFYNASNCYFGIDKNKYASNNIVFRSDAYKKYDQESFPNDIVNVDPLFIDVDNNDFLLHPNSPAIDKGKNLNFSHDFGGKVRPYGSSFDIGPYEYQGAFLPVAFIRYYNYVSKNSGHEPFRVSFDASDSYVPQGRSIDTYEWDFGDGSTGLGPTTNHTFSQGKYTVTLTVTDDIGNKHTASQEFEVMSAEYPNLYLYLPFDKDCLDASGKNMTIEYSEDLLFEESIYGKSIRLNNSKSRGISTKHNDYLDGIDEITFAFFAKKDAKDTAATILHKHTVYGIQITANGFAGSITTTSGTGKYSVAKVVNDTDWHHYAITYNGSNIITYLDGNECSRTELSGRIRRDSSRAIVIGRNPWGASFEGLLDEIRIYDRALSRDEIKQVIDGTPLNLIEDRLLTGIIKPKAIKNLTNGTTKTAAALGLPGVVTLTTDNGNVSTRVVWDVDGCSYNPALKAAQTFTVNGRAGIPYSVVNTNNIPLKVSVSVTVNKADAPDTPRPTPTPNPGYGSGSGSGSGSGYGSGYVSGSGSTIGATPTPSPTPLPLPDSKTTFPPINDQIEISKNIGRMNLTILVNKNDGDIRVETKLPIDRILNYAATKKPDAPLIIRIPLKSKKLVKHLEEFYKEQEKDQKDQVDKDDNKTKVNGRLLITMTLPDSILTNANIDISGIILSADILKAIRNLGKDLEINIYDDEGDILISYLFAASALRSSTNNIKDFNLLYTATDIAPGASLYDLVREKDKKKAEVDSPGLMLKLEHKGLFPAQADIKLFLGDHADFKPGNKIYLYHYNEATNKLETLPYSSKYKIDKDGYVTLNLLHGGEFVILPKAAKKEAFTSLVKQLSVTPKKVTLYVKDTKGNKAKTSLLEPTLPLSLEIVEKLKDKTSQEAIGGVVITYRSGNTKIAKVNKAGNITAVKKGSTYIYTKLTLYSNKSITLKTKVTVK